VESLVTVTTCLTHLPKDGKNINEDAAMNDFMRIPIREPYAVTVGCQEKNSLNIFWSVAEMKGRSYQKHLDRLYKRLPKVKCPEGCTKCCGPIWMSKEEREKLPEVENPDTGYDCPFIKDGKCSVYEKRPLVCRAFGTTRVGHLFCKEGGRPARFLSEKEIEDIMIRYMIICGGPENCETIGNLAKRMKEMITDAEQELADEA
jgi:uncharacterized protein